MSKQSIYVFLFFCTIFAVVLSVALSRLVPIDFWKLFIDGFIHLTLFAIITYLIWQVVLYGNYSALPFNLRIINYTAIGVLAIVIWLLVGYGLFYLLFGKNDSALIVNTLWIKSLIGILMYLLVIQFFYHYLGKKKENLKTEDLPDEKLYELTEPVLEHEILERIAVKSGQKIHVILVSEITFFQAEGDYVKIFTEKGKYLKEETMKYLQEHLPPRQFVRIHRSYIINVEMIQRIDVYEKQNQLVTMKNGEQIKASIPGYKQLKLVLNL
ncbi:MAG: LytTR family DNA-binding domain-containing protein [Paludibacteraceae bacterium]